MWGKPSHVRSKREIRMAPILSKTRSQFGLIYGFRFIYLNKPWITLITVKSVEIGSIVGNGFKYASWSWTGFVDCSACADTSSASLLFPIVFYVVQIWLLEGVRGERREQLCIVSVEARIDKGLRYKFTEWGVVKYKEEGTENRSLRNTAGERLWIWCVTSSIDCKSVRKGKTWIMIWRFQRC